MQVNKVMPNLTVETPNWLLQMENILEELNEGVVVVDSQLRVVFANEALLQLALYERGEMRGRTPDAIFPPEDIPYIMRQHELGHRYAIIATSFIFLGRTAKKSL
jgi:PAS domain S-box-containing protein